MLEVGERDTAGMEIPLLAEGDHPLGERLGRLGLGEGGLDAAVLDEAADLIRQERIAVGLRAAELDGLFLVTHGVSFLSFLLGVLFGDGRGGAVDDESGLELHAEAKAELDELVLDLVERLLAEVAVLEHLRLALEGELADAGDVGVVEAVRGADGELDLVDAHGEQLLEAAVLLADLGWGLVELDLVVIEVHENVEVVAEDRRGLEQGIVRGQTAVGPDLEDELIVVGTLTDAGLLNGVLDLGDGREDGVDCDHADRLVSGLVLVAGGESASDADGELGLELLLLVEGADVLIRIEDLNLVGRLDVAGSDGTLLVDREGQVAGLVVMGLELDLLEVEDDLDDVLDDARDAGELVRGPLDADRGDGGTFQRGEKRATERVANGVSITGLEGLGDELGVGFGGGFLVLDEGLRHFEATEANRHGILYSNCRVTLGAFR